jgi:urocanate hydratase
LCCMFLDEQTLVLYSGHPMGLFPSSNSAPRAVITNGMMIPNYSSRATYDRQVIHILPSYKLFLFTISAFAHYL